MEKDLKKQFTQLFDKQDGDSYFSPGRELI